MPTTIDDVVNVSLTLNTSNVTQQGFGTPLFLATFPATGNWANLRTKTYKTLSDLSTDFLNDDDTTIPASKTYCPEVFLMANSLLGQELRPKQFVVGRRDTTTAQSNVWSIPGSVTIGDIFTIQLNTKTFTFTATTTVKLDVFNGLKALIEANTALNAVTTITTDASSMTVAVLADCSLVCIPITSNISCADNTGAVESLTTTFTAVRQENDDWFAVILGKRSTVADIKTDQEALVTYIETVDRIAGISTFETTTASASLNSAGTDIGNVLKAAAVSQTFLIWSGNFLKYPEAAILGKQLPQNPGSNTYLYTKIKGITPDVISNTYLTNLNAKNVNTIQQISGGDTMMATEGIMPNGTFIDVKVGLLCIKARVKESVMRLLTSGKKVPFTNAGLSAVKMAVESPLRILAGADYGLILESSIKVIVPDVTAIAPADKANRYLNAVSFSCILQGAVHTVQVNGTIEV